MTSFLERLSDKHSVRPNISGKGDPPAFDEASGAWTTATKAQHSLLLLEEASDGQIHCQVPPRPTDRFRLGQINFTSLFPEAIVAFRLWCAAKSHDETDWLFLPNISWHLAFRLYSVDVANIKRTFEGHSQSGIEFRFVPASGDLSAYTQGQIVPCRYLHAGLLLNNDESEKIGFKGYRYSDATDAIQNFLKVQPIAQSTTESSQ